MRDFWGLSDVYEGGNQMEEQRFLPEGWDFIESEQDQVLAKKIEELKKAKDNNDTLEGIVNRYYVVTDGVLKLLEVSKDGYEFQGWYDNAEFEGEAVTELNSSMAQNIELWAKFARTSYVVTFKDGTEIINIKNIPAKGTVDYKPEKDGFEFVGWYIDEELTIAYEGGEVVDDLVLYAKYSELKSCNSSLGCTPVLSLALVSSIAMLLRKKRNDN